MCPVQFCKNGPCVHVAKRHFYFPKALALQTRFGERCGQRSCRPKTSASSYAHDRSWTQSYQARDGIIVEWGSVTNRLRRALSYRKRNSYSSRSRKNVERRRIFFSSGVNRRRRRAEKSGERSSPPGTSGANHIHRIFKRGSVRGGGSRS